MMEEKDIHIDGEEQKNGPVDNNEAAGPEEVQQEAQRDVEQDPQQATSEDVGTEPSEESERDPLDVALDEIAALKDKYLRQAAEFDNYRKRTLKERAELILNGGEKTIKAILPVVDDMERALKNGSSTDDPQVLRDGMELIYNKMMKTLEGLGVTKIETDGADFDTDLHDAEALVPGMGDEMKGKVIDCIATGYKLNDKVIRHAKVAVGQ